MGSVSCCSIKAFPCKGALSRHSLRLEGASSNIALECKGVMLQGSEARENGAQQPVQLQGPGQVCHSACLLHAVYSVCTAQSQQCLHGVRHAF